MLLFSACTTAGQGSAPLTSPPAPQAEATTTTSLPDPTTTTAAEPTGTAGTPTTTVPPETELAPTQAASIARPFEYFPDIEPVLSGTAAKLTPIKITEPTPPTATFMVGAQETEITISFAADGNGQIEWYSRVLPSGPLTYRGKAPSLDITLTIAITEDSRSYLITADGKNPRAGEDSITILLMRGSG